MERFKTMRSSETRKNSETMENSDIMEISIPTKPIKLEKKGNGRHNQICNRLPEGTVQAFNVSISTVVVQ